ncbi:hypothetical protein MKW94_008512 [Papaver nudicaule]|uniref:EGF-like domain-containing protein n=1 Tax=Papaver nudicaule TaxID=74823 RepID=A0AA42AT92_PAPNU|nr:hypothetical protein [Papaver nudicaule]
MISHHTHHHASIDSLLFFKPYVIILSILVLRANVCIAQETNQERYEKCKNNFVCGNRIDVGYPFWGVDHNDGDKSRPDYCGLPSYKLDCYDGDIAEIKIGEETYRVLEINSSSQAMNITNKEFLDDDDACPAKYSIANFGSPLFNDAPDVVPLFLYFDCLSFNPPDQFTYRFKCNTGTRDAYFWFTEAPPIPDFTPDFRSCGKIVQVHVMKEALEGLTAKPETLPIVIKQGFNVTYIYTESGSSIDICPTCSGSGGACGYNTTTSNPTCFCPDGTTGISCGMFFSSS